MHQQPARVWTVEALAAQVAMSRSAFATRFAHLTGEPPLQYLTRLRMQRAERLLKTSKLTLAEIATHVGYQSEMAFSKAFRQRKGIAPGRYRRT